MSNEPNSPEQPSPPAASVPPISPDFLTGSIDIGLERIRTRLLDLTNRNKLLNFRHSSSSTLRVVDVHLNTVFRHLIEGEKLDFRPVPEPDEDFSEKPAAADYAEQIGWRISQELDEPAEPQDYDGALPVLHYTEHLDTLTRKIASAATTVIEESGTNMLYLVFGFLEWYESDDSRQPRYAPLVIVPVTIERSAGRGKAFQCELEYSGEDLDTNLSLIEKMRKDLGLEIPALEDDDTPEDYFARFHDLLSTKKRWRMRREITLSLLSFGKLLMFRDLDPQNWPADSALARNTLVRELFEGTKNFEITHAEEFSIDDEELKQELPPLILDADSSQHSALIHAMRGQNLVIEGPPGTGKSQTITNLIAAVLAKGKTVLFISEKLAALEVVRRRLDDCGLGVFCLELHSHKTKKGALLNDLAQRLKLRGSFRDPQDLDRHLAVAEDKKHRLTEYVSLINKTIEPFQASIFDILWARDRAYQELPFKRDVIGHLLLPSLAKASRTEYMQAEQFCAVYSQHLSMILGLGGETDRHPWAWVRRPLSFDQEQQCLVLLQDFIDGMREARECFQTLKEATDISLSASLANLEHAGSLLAALPSADGALKENLLFACREAGTRQTLAAFITNVEQFQSASDRLLNAASRGHALLEPENHNAEKLGQEFERLHSLGLDGHSISELKTLHQRDLTAEQSLAQTRTCFESVLSLLGCEAPLNANTITFLLEACRTAETLPIELLRLRSESFKDDGTTAHLRAAKEECNALTTSHTRLSSTFNLSFAPTASASAEFTRHAATITETPFLKRWGTEYRGAIKGYKKLTVARKKARREQMTQDFCDIAAYCTRRSNFDNNPAHRTVLGPHFAGTDTRWDDLLRLAGWYEEVFTTFPEHNPHAAPFRQLFFTSRTERMKAFRTGLRTVAEHRSQLEQALSHITAVNRVFPRLIPLAGNGTVDDIFAALKQINQQVAAALTEIDQFGIKDNVLVGELSALLTAAADGRRARGEIENAAALPQLLGADFKGVSTQVGVIKTTVQFADSIATRSLPQKSVEWLLSKEYENRLGQLRSWLTTSHDILTRLSVITQELAQVSDSPLWKDNAEEFSGALEALAAHALEYPEDLSRWIHFLHLREESVQAGMQKLTVLADQKAFGPQHLAAAFAYVFYNTLARSVFSEHPRLSQFTGLTLEQLRQQFANADKDSIRLHRKRIAAQIDRRAVSNGSQSGPVGAWSDLALLTHEINKQKRHIPIRQLTRRAGGALLGLKPCFMMGPLSVAQYLAPGQLKFDLIVMDEASQLKPEDAIGAMARGAQIVIVGDPKQLPPTTFFQRVQLDGDGDGDGDGLTAVEEGESILDVASTLYQPIRRLRWHYRSRHHSLIAFSNREFYQGDLVIFPSAYHEDPSLGVKYNAVPGGILENRRNPREAAVVVEAVMEHMKNCPHESLGVVTLNFEQRELVEELLDQRLRNDPFTASYQEKMKGPESFFVKNLENVQGDERDVIFISVTYGPDALGNQFQRFGPINGENGHRRLNVLFTRAKKRTVVFSSLDPDKIQVTPTSPWGLRVLKQYLTFARTGILEGPDYGLEQPINDFEASVGAILKERNFHVVPQVGVAGFFIDLGVTHPVKPGTFLLGIECDGAGYHSGRSARDRDRLRQEILVNLGWKIHRIWSTDWFKSRDSEIQRLFKRIDELLASDPDYRKEADKAQTIETLRRRLIDFRETVIKPAFPDSPLEQGLLRKALLDEFVAKRPKTKDEWFRKISHDLRSGSDPAQVGQYLATILKIIGECGDD
jgi:very-short-patch-repair endonuclease